MSDDATRAGHGRGPWERNKNVKRIRHGVGMAVVLAALVAPGCTQVGMVRLPFIKYPIERVYRADFDKTWKAAVAAMKEYDLVVQDPGSGLLISDWIRGNSDTYRYHEKDGADKPCRCEFSIHANVEEVEKDAKTKVHVDIYEKTLIVYPETGPVWKMTATSTLKEKAILDKIDEILSKG